MACIQNEKRHHGMRLMVIILIAFCFLSACGFELAQACGEVDQERAEAIPASTCPWFAMLQEQVRSKGVAPA